MDGMATDIHRGYAGELNHWLPNLFFNMFLSYPPFTLSTPVKISPAYPPVTPVLLFSLKFPGFFILHCLPQQILQQGWQLLQRHLVVRCLRQAFSID